MAKAPQFEESALVSSLDQLQFMQLVVFMENLTEEIKYYAQRNNTDQEWIDAQASKLAEETGEFTKEYNRYRGWSRTAGEREAVLEELADVVISGFAMFAILDEDAHHYIMKKLRKVITRGYVNPAE